MVETYRRMIVFFNDLSIRTKLIVSVAFIILLMGAMMGSYLDVAQTKMMTNELNEKGYSITRNLAGDCVNPMLLGNDVRVNSLAKSVKETDNDIVYVFILDENRNLITHTFESGFPVDLYEINPASEDISTQLIDTEHGYIRDISYPILNGRSGEVHVGMSQENIIVAVNRFNKFFIVFLFLLLLVGMNIAYISGSFISAPIMELKEGVELFGDGNLSHKVNVSSDNEVGDLARTFNDMADHISTLIKEKENTAKELLEARNYLTKIISGSLDGIVVFDDEGYIEFANWSFFKIANCEERDVIGKNIREFINDDIEDLRLDHKSIKDEGAIQEHEVDLRTADGHIRSLLASVGNVTYDDQTKYVAVTKDVTEVRKLDEMKKNIISNISHELRTPLNIMRGYVDLSIEEEDAEKRNAYLDKSLKALDKQKWMIQDLLEVAREDGDMNGLDLVKASINGIVDIAIKNLNGKVEASGVELKKNLAEDRLVEVDPEKMVYALNKILDNALKFTDKGKNVEIGTTLKDSRVTIYVKDNGVGISTQDLEKIFDKFYQADGSSTRRFGGNGLGLSIAKKIVERHGGKLWADSTLNMGSTFYIDIPYFESSVQRVSYPVAA